MGPAQACDDQRGNFTGILQLVVTNVTLSLT